MNLSSFIANDFMGVKKPKNKKAKSFEAKFSEALAVDSMRMRYVAPSKFENMTHIEKRLRKYIKGEGIKIMVSSIVESEMFVTSGSGFASIILCDDDIYESADFRICSLAHELGHYLDYKHNFDYDSEEFSKYSVDEVDNIETETIAWEYAKEVLYILGYTNWDYFKKIALKSLTTYTYNDESIAEACLKGADAFKVRRAKIKNDLCGGEGVYGDVI